MHVVGCARINAEQRSNGLVLKEIGQGRHDCRRHLVAEEGIEELFLGVRAGIQGHARDPAHVLHHVISGQRVDLGVQVVVGLGPTQHVENPLLDISGTPLIPEHLYDFGDLAREKRLARFELIVDNSIREGHGRRHEQQGNERNGERRHDCRSADSQMERDRQPVPIGTALAGSNDRDSRRMQYASSERPQAPPGIPAVHVGKTINKSADVQS